MAKRNYKRRYPPSHPKKSAHEWQPFREIDYEWTGLARATQLTVQLAGDDNRAYANNLCDAMRSDEYWKNNLYFVAITYLDRGNLKQGGLHLDIHRLDQAPIYDWRHLQRIKNELAGPDREAVELYPAVSRLVDTANSYHLWVVPEGETVGCGFTTGAVVGSEYARRIGAKQRDYHPDDPCRALYSQGEEALEAEVRRTISQCQGPDRRPRETAPPHQ